MNRNYYKGLGFLAFLACCQAASAQYYHPGCWTDGMPPRGPSDDYIAYDLPAGSGTNQLFQVAVGVNGTMQFNKGCVGPNGATFDVRGRFAFGIGATGSIQSTFDDNLSLTYGYDPGTFLMAGGSIAYGMVVEQPVTGGAEQRTFFGANAMDTAFIGASDRYFTMSSTAGSFRVRLQVDLIGDAARVNWRMQNTTANQVRGGLWFGAWVRGFNLAPYEPTYPFLDPNIKPMNFITAPGYRPIRVGTVFSRIPNQVFQGLSRPSFAIPDYINFGVTQENAYGLQVVNTATMSGNGPNSDQTPVDEIRVGLNQFAGGGGLLGNFASNTPNFPDQILEDTKFADDKDPSAPYGLESAFLQKWYPSLVNAGATREINAYYKSTWSNSDYARPFSAVVDAPNLIATNADNANEFQPNPFTFRVYVDNTRGYSQIDREIALEQVRIQVSLPPGMTDANDPTKTTLDRIIPRVSARELRFADFQVRVSPEVFGIQPYTVRITTSTGAQKTITGTINVAATPRLRLPSNANLVTVPWRFDNPSWEAILGLRVDEDFQAFTWDPQQNEYVIQTGPERGRGTWIITEQTRQSFQLGGNPREPEDLTTGANQISIRPGWNLIANPYNYSIPLGQLIGVNSANPNQSYSFRELVDQGIISPALAYWDQDSPTPEYKYIQNQGDLLLPNRGYWIFVNGSQFVTISFPPVYEPFLPARSTASTWVQSDKQWRLQLSARNEKQVDSQNFVGVARSAAEAKRSRYSEPPIAPVDGALSLAISEDVDGKPTKLAQTLSETAGRREWTVTVYSKEGGNVTLNWPNLSTVPKNMQFRVVDVATGATRNLRKASGYTYTTEERSTRTFKVQMEPGVAQRPVIGNIIAARSTRSPSSPLTISYTLASEATTTVRILQGGREIYVPSRGRADSAGENTVIWNLRDAANRAVASGTYTVELTAESASGDRVRKIYPVNIIR